MTTKKKQAEKTVNNTSEKVGVAVHPVLDYSGHDDDYGNEPWREWKVKPDIVYMPFTPPEVGIGKRIAYCRGQLDNLSVEALARYTKNFDSDGVSRASIVRYESGDSFPGARELRIFCDAFWIPANWLLFGLEDRNAKVRAEESAVSSAILNLIRRETSLGSGIPSFAIQDAELNEIQEKSRRQYWLYKARNYSKN